MQVNLTHFVKKSKKKLAQLVSQRTVPEFKLKKK